MGSPEAQQNRRLPVYFLIDRSSTLSGEPMIAINQGLQFFKSELENESRAVETVWISVISFGETANVDAPLIELMAYHPPELHAGGSTSLGEALRLLNSTIDRDVILSTGKNTGDYKPLVFIVLASQPTDDWHEPLRVLVNRSRPRFAELILIVAGLDVDRDQFRDRGLNVVGMEDTTAGDFQKMLSWIGQEEECVHLSFPG